LDAGINFVDTADGYSAGESELIVGKARAGGRRDDVVLAVKFGVPLGEDPNHGGPSPRWITQAVEGSLRRLQTDWIDLYRVGVPDPKTDIDETLDALSDLVRAGKIPSFGASKVPASQIVEARWTAERRGHGRFRTEQPPHSLLTRAKPWWLLAACDGFRVVCRVSRRRVLSVGWHGFSLAATGGALRSCAARHSYAPANRAPVCGSSPPRPRQSAS
jgi:aryl-alcohol dehydrogenase-like predicted oxidoreductase